MAIGPAPIIAPPATYLPGSALFHGALGEPAMAATLDTPLPVIVGPGATNLSLIERLNREGDPSGTANRTSFSTFTANASGPQPVLTPAPGRAVFVQSVQAWSTTPIAGRLQLNSGGTAWSGTGTFPLMDMGFGCGPGYAANIDVNAFVRSGDRTGIGVTIPQWLDAAVTGTHVVGCSASAWTLADSINFDAKKVALMIGDSTWNGTGPSNVLTCIPWLINKFYRDQGQDTRYILKAYSGSSSVGHENYRGAGKYEFPQVDAIFYNLGINDAGQSVSTATRTANVQALIAWKQRRYAKAKLVIFGTTPVQDNSLEAAIAAIRTADAATVAAAADPNILFCNLGASFDRTVGANYATSDGADGSRIHPVDTGLTQVWNGGYGGYAGLKAWLLANLPAI